MASALRRLSGARRSRGASALNLEAVMPEPRARIAVRPCAIHEPGEGEVLLRSEHVAVHPFEAEMQSHPFYDLEYPLDLGITFAGTVETVGAGVTTVQKGDRVAVCRSALLYGDRRTGAHQKYAIAKPENLFKLPPGANAVEAAAIVGNLVTVVAVLCVTAGLDRPSASPDPANAGKKVLVYGGSSQLGRLAVQYARQAGYAVVTTSSPQHLADVSSLRPAKVVEQGAGADDVAARLVAEGPYVSVFDTVSVAESQAALTPVLRDNKTKGHTGVAWSVQPQQAPAAGVEFALYSWPVMLLGQPEHDEQRRWFFDEYMPGIFEGRYEMRPTNVERVPGGLYALQGMLDVIPKVSAKKLVYSPWNL